MSKLEINKIISQNHLNVFWNYNYIYFSKELFRRMLKDQSIAKDSPFELQETGPKRHAVAKFLGRTFQMLQVSLQLSDFGPD